MNTLELGKQRASELGIESFNITIMPGDCKNSYYHADDIHKLLGEGVDVGRYKAGLSMSAWAISHMDHAEETALLIGIRPIVQESEERKLLRRVIDSNIKEWDQVLRDIEALLERE